jgi:hypothetical protein
MTKKGPKIIEIGPRIGGYRTRMYQMANDVNLDMLEIETASGNQVRIPEIKSSNAVSVMEIFPETEERFIEATAYSELVELRTLKYVSLKAEKGLLTGPAGMGYKAPLVVILSGSNQNQVKEESDWVRENVKIITSGRSN